ncbi:hypothetical protein LCGC14_1759000 [marine sediment metagenome]|uniref:Uncharacterized protein n=1 Tax=marine sediment metagenome TaxID=412755 RepID=A0A0F9H1Q2_9ZZZZ
MKEREMKYKNCAEVIEAFKKGEVNGVWCLDNDHSFIYDEEKEEMIFRGSAENKLVLEILDALGIPAERV